MNQIKLHNESNNYKATFFFKKKQVKMNRNFGKHQKNLNRCSSYFISELMTLQQPWICGPGSWSWRKNCYTVPSWKMIISKTCPFHDLVKIKGCKFQFHSSHAWKKYIKHVWKTGSFTWKLKNIYNSQEHNIKIKSKLSFSFSFSNKIHKIYIYNYVSLVSLDPQKR